MCWRGDRAGCRETARRQGSQGETGKGSKQKGETDRVPRRRELEEAEKKHRTRKKGTPRGGAGEWGWGEEETQDMKGKLRWKLRGPEMQKNSNRKWFRKLRAGEGDRQTAEIRGREV